MQKILLAFGLCLVACNGTRDPDVPDPTPTVGVSADSTHTVSPNPPVSAEPASVLLKDGAACSDGSACASGTCEGPGCGAEAGTCAPSGRRCLRDRRAFCGCDGTTFHAGSNCPGRLFEKAGPCEETP